MQNINKETKSREKDLFKAVKAVSKRSTKETDITTLLGNKDNKDEKELRDKLVSKLKQKEIDKMEQSEEKLRQSFLYSDDSMEDISDEELEVMNFFMWNWIIMNLGLFRGRTFFFSNCIFVLDCKCRKLGMQFHTKNVMVEKFLSLSYSHFFFKSVIYCTLSRRLKLHIWKEHCYCQNSQKMAILFFRGKNCQKVLFFDNVSAFCNSFFPLLPCSFWFLCNCGFDQLITALRDYYFFVQFVSHKISQLNFLLFFVYRTIMKKTIERVKVTSRKI